MGLSWFWKARQYDELWERYHNDIQKERRWTDFWKAKSLEYYREIRKANKGIQRLRRKLDRAAQREEE